jgi:hypothetical protein
MDRRAGAITPSTVFLTVPVEQGTFVMQQEMHRTNRDRPDARAG